MKNRNRLIQSVAFGILWMYLVSPALAQREPDTDCYQEGNVEYGRGHYDAAIALYTKEIERHIAFSDAYFNRGVCYEVKKDWKPAIADFTAVLTKKPKMYDAYVERGTCFSGLGDFVNANKDFAQAISIKPRRPDGYLARGDSDFNQKQYDAAVADYTRYFTESKFTEGIDVTVYSCRGIANSQAGHYEAAISDLNTFIAQDPKEAASAYSFLGDAYLGKHDYPKAINAYTKDIDAHADDKARISLKYRALAFLQNRQLQQSIADYTAFLAVKPGDPEAIQNLAFAKQAVIYVSIVGDKAKPDKNDPKVLKLLADAYYRFKNYSSAIATYSAILQKDSNDTDALLHRGQSYESQKLWKQAIADFTTLLEKQPADYDAFVDRGRSYSGFGDFENAHKDFAQAMAIQPTRSAAYLAQADADFNQKQYEAAIADYTKYFDNAKAADFLIDPSAYTNRGTANYAAGHYDEAIADFNKFIALDPKDAAGTDVYSFLGNAYLGKQDYPNAIAAYTRHLTLNPNDKTGAALKGRGLAYFQEKQYKLAIADFTAYLAFHPDDTEFLNVLILGHHHSTSIADLELAAKKAPDNQGILNLLADAYFQAKKYSSAIDVYTQILAKNPGDSVALFNRATAEGMAGDKARAVADFTAYTQAQPTDPPGWNSLGVYQAQMSDWSAATASFTRYITLKPDDIEAYKNRGLTEYNAKNYAAALPDLEKYDAAKPGDAEVIKVLPDLYEGPSNPEERDKALQAAARKNPYDAKAQLNLGVALLRARKYPEAVEVLTKSITLKPSYLAYFDRAYVYYNLGRAGETAAYPKAAADAGKALELKPNYPEALLLKADSEFAAKSYVLAKADYTQYAAMDSTTPDNKTYAVGQTMQVGIALKDYAGVVNATTALIAANPNEPSNYQIRGAAYTAMMNYAMAIPDLVKYTGMKPKDAQGFYALGVAFEGKKDDADAGTAFERAFDLDAANYEAGYRAGRAHVAVADSKKDVLEWCLPEYDKAVQIFRRAAAAFAGKQRKDLLYEEATTLDTEAKLSGSKELKSEAAAVWREYQEN